MGDPDALHTARAALGGRPINLTTDEVFALLGSDFRISARELLEARRAFDAMQIGIAVEAVEKAADRQARLSALLRLARALSPHLKDRLPGWFRFLLAFGGQRGESRFQLSVVRRPHSESAQPRRALHRATQTGQAVDDMLVAGAILSRIEAATVSSVAMPLQAAIEAAINDGDIATEEGTARKAFQRFRKACAQLTGGGDTYRLERYAGPVENYRGRWVALPDIGNGLSRLPSGKGGRPKT
jgi:hypothetical protein